MRDLLKRTNMSEAKDVTTSISSTTSLSLHDSSILIDSKLYQSIVGTLQYLSLIHPIISFVVNKLP